MSERNLPNEAEGSASGQGQSLPRTGAPVLNAEPRVARVQPPPPPRRTLDGYQAIVPGVHAPRPRNPNLPRATKTAGVGHGGPGNQDHATIIAAQGAAGGAAVGAGAGAGRGGIRGPAVRFDASRRPPPIRSASTLSASTAFPPPIPRRDHMRIQRQAQQAERASRQSIASSSARQLRTDVGQRLHGMFPPSATIQRRVEHQRQQPQPPLAASSGKSVHKGSRPFKPLRQVIEEERIEEILRLSKQGDIIRPQRIGARSTVAQLKTVPPHPSLPIAYIDERLRLRIVGEDSDAMDVDEDEDDDGVVQVGRKSLPNPAKRLAARKTDITPASSSESESSSEEEDAKSASSGPTLEYVSEVEDQRPPAEASDDDDIYATEEEVIPDIIILDDPRQAPPSALVGSAEPPPDMLAALAPVLQPTIKLQRAKRLPFTLRSLRVGFLKLCRELKVPSYSSGRRVSLSVHYMYTNGALYQTKVDSWRCPLCSLMGVMPTRQMLECHLKWDHPEFFYEWRKLLETQEEESWEVQIVIAELVQPAYIPAKKRYLNARDERIQPHIHVTPPQTETITRTQQGAPAREASIPAPPSIFSAPSVRESTATLSDTLDDDDVKPVVHDESIPRSREDRSVTLSTQSATTTTTTPRPSLSLRSTTASTDQPPRQRRPTVDDGTLPVDPPPADDPLGPAARPPYLPAESDYGGPKVYYSCRPGGPCLFDLLGTLPLGPYGLLDWEILEREEEIYESDDVKDEYKVMQALWSRWIVLNRNLFVSNYYKGVKAFVDQYWKFIHKAAGWAALRYWLFILLANDFLVTHEVAQTLLHYEGLTGMARWYTPVLAGPSRTSSVRSSDSQIRQYRP